MSISDAQASPSKIAHYDPPGFMTDFDSIPGQLDQWSAALSGWFDEVVESEQEPLGGQACQYYNQLRKDPGPVVEQDIVWNALSGTLVHLYGEKEALEFAEKMLPLSEREDLRGPYHVGPQWEKLFYRPHDEYCEWRVERNADGRIQRVTFTSEPPEYWQALYGDSLRNFREEAAYPMTGDPDLVLELYREYVSADVEPEDLVCSEDLVDHSDPQKPEVVYRKGEYNPYNRWNTTDGIMHLTQPANTLGAEVKLAGDGTVLRRRAGRRISDPDMLICCAGYGGANRRSDPTIGASVNELAALGCWVTLRNPVGLYMDHMQLAGVTKPGGSPVGPEYFQILRGRPGLVERAVFEVPEEEAKSGLTVSDLSIGGMPIRYGGQLAQLVTVKLVGLASAPGAFSNKPAQCEARCCIDPARPQFLRQVAGECPAGQQEAFAYPDVRNGDAVIAKTDAAALEIPASEPPPAPARRQRTGPRRFW